MDYRATRVEKKEPKLLFRMNTNKARNHQYKLLHLQKTPLIEDPDNHMKECICVLISFQKNMWLPLRIIALVSQFSPT